MLFKVTIVCVVVSCLALSGMASGNDVEGPPAESTRTNQCAATLSDFAWLQGRWHGELSVGVFELEYSKPSGGMITSMFRLIPNDRATMLEFVALRVSEKGLELRFRHFTPALIAWEEKDQPIVMRCVASGEDTWTFENPDHDRPKRSVFTRLSNDQYTFRTQIGSGNAARFMEGTAYRVGTERLAMMKETGRILTKEAVVNGTPAQVWAAWTDPKEMGKFFAADSSIIDLQIGGKYELHMVPDAPPGGRGCEGCTILSYLPLRMLSFTWTAPPSIPGLRDKGIMTHVVVTMDELPTGQTKVRIAQMGFGEGEDWDKCYAYFDQAWPTVLGWLQEKIGTIQPSGAVATSDPRLTFDVEVDALTSDVWKAFTTKSGIESWMVPLAEVDFKVNGSLHTNYDAKGSIGDPGTISHRIMSYEPERMLAFQIAECPEGFPHEEATKGTWAVVQLDPVDDAKTRVRLASAGLKVGLGSEEMIKHFEQGNAWTLRQLQKRFASESEQAMNTETK